MNPKPMLLSLAGVAALVLATTLPLSGQAPLAQVVPASAAPAEDPAVIEGLLSDIVQQHVKIADNQTKLDEKIAAVIEEVRQARIYAGRGGGKTK